MTEEEITTDEAVNIWYHAVAKTETTRKACTAAENAYNEADDVHAAAVAAANAAGEAFADAMAAENTALAAARASWVAENEEVQEGSYED